MAFKWLSDLAEPDRDRFGSKSLNLALLVGWGLPVPEGFAVAFEKGRTGILSAEERPFRRSRVTSGASEQRGTGVLPEKPEPKCGKGISATGNFPYHMINFSQDSRGQACDSSFLSPPLFSSRRTEMDRSLGASL